MQLLVEQTAQEEIMGPMGVQREVMQMLVPVPEVEQEVTRVQVPELLITAPLRTQATTGYVTSIIASCERKRANLIVTEL